METGQVATARLPALPPTALLASIFTLRIWLVYPWGEQTCKCTNRCAETSS